MLYNPILKAQRKQLEPYFDLLDTTACRQCKERDEDLLRAFTLDNDTVYLCDNCLDKSE